MRNFANAFRENKIPHIFSFAEPKFLVFYVIILLQHPWYGGGGGVIRDSPVPQTALRVIHSLAGFIALIITLFAVAHDPI